MFEIADISEFNGVVHPNASLGAIIIRAHNGNRADHDFVVNRANAQAAGLQAVGIYQYLVQSRDAAEQARELIATTGPLRANEFLVCDLEEGSGNQQARWQAWRAIVVAATQRQPWLYSGLAFSEAHNLQPEWVAAYQAREPGTPWTHKLWQNSDNWPWPWGRDDGSVFDGTLLEFLTAVGITGAPQTPSTTTPASSTTEAITVQLTPGSKTAPFILPNPGSVLWVVADAGGEFPVNPADAAQVRVMCGHGGPGSAWKPLPGGNAQTGNFGVLNGTAMKITPDMCAGTGQKIVSVRNMDPRMTINTILVP